MTTDDQPTPTRNAKIQLAALTAALTWIGLALELYGFIHRALMQQLGVLHGIATFLNFFTNLSNLLAAITLTLWVKHTRSKEGGFPNYLDITSMVVYVWLAGLVYNLMLRGLFHANWPATIILHDIVPVLFLIFWWTCIPRLRFTVKQVLSWLLFPIVYFIYTLIRGALGDRYPYPFLDVSKFGYGMIMENALGIMFALLALSMVLVVLNNLKPNNLKPK
ncbi:MAG TPA: Pr6Pr family membrane protein [Methylophilaceae bacterium]|jgi:hypothetical protein